MRTAAELMRLIEETRPKMNEEIHRAFRRLAGGMVTIAEEMVERIALLDTSLANAGAAPKPAPNPLPWPPPGFVDDRLLAAVVARWQINHGGVDGITLTERDLIDSHGLTMTIERNATNGHHTIRVRKP